MKNSIYQWFCVVSAVALVAVAAGCERVREYGVEPRKPDERTMGLAATRNKSVGAEVGFSAFDNMPLMPTLAELRDRFEIHMLTDDESQTTATQFNAQYAHVVPDWWPKDLVFKATFFMREYVVYLAESPARQGFVMLRVQRGKIAVVPPFSRRRLLRSEETVRADKVRQSMKTNGIPVSPFVVERASLRNGDEQVERYLFSQNECGAKAGDPESLGAISLVTIDATDDTVKSVKQLPVPLSVVPCYEGTNAGRRYVVDRAVSLGSVMQSPLGNLVMLGINHRVGGYGMMWPGDTLQGKYYWIFWCRDGADCELVTQGVNSDDQLKLENSNRSGKAAALAVGLDEENHATLQEWLFDRGSTVANSVICERTTVKSTWRLSERAVPVSLSVRIRKGPLVRAYIKESKTFAYTPAAHEFHRNRPHVFLGTYPSDCGGS